VRVVSCLRLVLLLSAKQTLGTPLIDKSTYRSPLPQRHSRLGRCIVRIVGTSAAEDFSGVGLRGEIGGGLTTSFSCCFTSFARLLRRSLIYAFKSAHHSPLPADDLTYTSLLPRCWRNKRHDMNLSCHLESRPQSRIFQNFAPKLLNF
jgi:hypothetical protein